MKQKPTVVIVGGGAAGFFCAINVAQQMKAHVIILEKTTKLLSKVKVSGGGRCNVTHNATPTAEYAKKYPRGEKFVRKTWHQFTFEDTVKWFEKRGVHLKAENDGRMFPISDDSQTIIDCFLKEAHYSGVTIETNAGVNRIQRLEQEDQFLIEYGNNKQMVADAVCIAVGAYPKLPQFEWIQATIQHEVAAPVPSLFTFNLPKHPITKLMGVAVNNVTAKILGTKLVQSGPLLITHWGMSGPAILKLSAYGARTLAEKNWEFDAMINWTGDLHEDLVIEKLTQAKLEHPNQQINNQKLFSIPSRLWEFLLQSVAIEPQQKWIEISQKSLNKLAKQIAAYVVSVKGKTTFKEEFVTAGGIQLSEIDANTLMSKKVENLFFAGEIMDIDGVTGGFNFQNAWTTAYIAATNIVARLK